MFEANADGVNLGQVIATTGCSRGTASNDLNELVQRVTGHRTVAVVPKHDFRPGLEDFRQVLFKAIPKC